MTRPTMLPAYSRGRAVAKAVLVIVACSAFGAWLLWLGATGLIEGQVTIHPRRAPSYTAYPSGPTSGAFHFKVWLALLVGTMFAGMALALIALLAFGGKQRRDAALRRLQAHRLAGGSPRVPGWVAAAVIVALLAFLTYVAVRWHLPR
jgi:hypothetical protein